MKLSLIKINNEVTGAETTLFGLFLFSLIWWPIKTAFEIFPFKDNFSYGVAVYCGNWTFQLNILLRK